MANLVPNPKFRVFDSNGDPLVGGKLWTLKAGTVDEQLDTYVDAGGNTLNTNPIILDAYGECDLWLGSDTYKLVMYTADGDLLWSVDNIAATYLSRDDTSLAGAVWFLNEEDLASDSPDKVPSQHSVKAYIDGGRSIDLEFTVDGKGIIFSDGTKITREADGGLVIIPNSDAHPVVIRNAADDADVLVLKPLSDAEAIAGEITNQPPSAVSMKAAIDAGCDARHLYAQYQHTAASGTAGGIATSGAWRALPISVETTDGIGCTLTSNVITMPAGKYEVDFNHAFFYTEESMARLKVTPTGGSTVYYYSNVGNTDAGFILGGKAIIDLIASNGGTIAWEYQVKTTRGTDGLGQGATFGVTNIFGSIDIRRIK